MDYDNVNNPFITLKRLSGDGVEKEFKAKLNTVPPSVEFDDNRSGMKKPDHALRSDNRATKMKASDNDGTFKKYSVTLTDIDNVLYEYFTNVIAPQVPDSLGEAIPVPVRHASPERWAAIQRDGVLRDPKGQLQRPIIVFTRTGLEKDNELTTFNKYLTVPFVKKFDKYNMYDRFGTVLGIQPSYEVHNITFPDHVILSYDFTIMTEFVEQMNGIVERINFASDDYWGDPKRFKFRASVQSFANTVEVPTDDDRVVSTTFSLTVNAHLLPEIFDNQTTSQRSLTKRSAVFSSETTQTQVDKSPYELPHSRNMFTLHRKQRILYLNDVDVDYQIETWNDEDFYEISLLDEALTKISFTSNNGLLEYITWDLDGSADKIHRGGSLLISFSGSYDAQLEVRDSSAILITISFVKKND
jgi:hypothetical protein